VRACRDIFFALRRHDEAMKPKPLSPHSVLVPLDGEGSGSDWKRWAQVEMPAALKAAPSAAVAQAILDVNKSALDTLATVSPAALGAVVALADKIIDRFVAEGK